MDSSAGCKLNHKTEGSTKQSMLGAIHLCNLRRRQASEASNKQSEEAASELRVAIACASQKRVCAKIVSAQHSDGSAGDELARLPERCYESKPTKSSPVMTAAPLDPSTETATHVWLVHPMTRLSRVL